MADSWTQLAGEQVTGLRADEQIAYYGRKSRQNRRLFKSLKAVTISAAASIPVLTTGGIPHGVSIAAGLGILIAVLEGLQQLNQFQANWTMYRGTAEALKHEKFLFLARAGPYRSAHEAASLFAERVEMLVAQEGSNWSALKAAQDLPTRSQP